MTLDGFEIVNIGVKGVGHSDLVGKPEGMMKLRDAGILDRLYRMTLPKASGVLARL